jgi:hypothetical protein
MPFNFSLRRMPFFAVLVAWFGACGCSQSPLPVKGQLVWEDSGKPIDGANVRFVPMSGTQEAVGVTDKDGAFTLVSTGGTNGVLPGEYKIVVTKTTITGAVPTGKGGGETGPSDEEKANMMKGMMKKQGSGPPRVTDPIPEMYRNEEKTPLREKVSRSDQKIELKIKRS